MTRYVYTTATTANGLLADEQDSLDWLFAVPGEAPDLAALQEGVGLVVMGSTTYEWLLRQDELRDHPEKLAEYYPGIAIVVFSSRALPVPPGIDLRVVSGPVSEHLADFERIAGEGKVWIMGGGELAGQFLDANVLDGIELTIAPAFLAAGRSLFPRELHGARLTLRDTWRVGQWIEVRYDVARTA